MFSRKLLRLPVDVCLLHIHTLKLWAVLLLRPFASLSRRSRIQAFRMDPVEKRRRTTTCRCAGLSSYANTWLFALLCPRRRLSQRFGWVCAGTGNHCSAPNVLHLCATTGVLLLFWLLAIGPIFGVTPFRIVAWCTGTTTQLSHSLPDLATNSAAGAAKPSSVIREQTVGPPAPKSDPSASENAGPTSSEWRHRIATGELTPDDEPAGETAGWREQTLEAMNQATAGGSEAQRLATEADALLAAGKDQEALAQYQAACQSDPGSVHARIRAAELLGNMGKWDKAAMRYEEALRLDPHHEPALRGLAEIELHRGHQRAAVGLARILVDCDNRAATSQLLLARALLADNCPADALASAERARQLAPDVWECRLVEADALAALGRLGRAEERYLQTAADHPEALAAYLGVARCRERHQGARQALSYLQALPQAVQGRDQIAMAVARLHRDLGEESQAIARYREIVRRNPSLAEPRLSLARLLMKRGGLGDAQELLAGVLADEPGNVAARLALARLYLRTGLPALAGKHAGKALGDDEESNRSARLLFAEAEAACGRETQAIRLIRQNLAEQPKDLPSRRLLVGLLLRTGNADEALEEVKDIEELFPDRPDAASLRGDVYLAAANYEQAIASYRRALLQAPEDPVVMRQLAIVLCEQQGTLEEADSLSAKALQREPQDAETMDTRGWVLYRLGKADVAAAVLERATRLAPGDGTIHYHLGVVLADLGRKELAIQELRRALSSTTVSGARQDAQKRLASLLLAPDDE